MFLSVLPHPTFNSVPTSLQNDHPVCDPTQLINDANDNMANKLVRVLMRFGCNRRSDSKNP